MRVLVRSRKSDKQGPGNDTVEVVNAETGEQIQGITSLTFRARSDNMRNQLILEIADCDVELDGEADVVPAHQEQHDEIVLSVGAVSRMIQRGIVPQGRFETRFDDHDGYVNTVFIAKIPQADGNDDVCYGVNHA